MSEFSFDGRVAVVTGAGRGIGRAHARLLARRGAKVVVNDLGGSMDGEGADTGPAQQVVDEIRAAGGEAVADTHDVSTEAGGQAIVDSAIEHFGRIDVLVNNAGIIRWAGLPEVDLDNLERHLAVHLIGSFNTLRAAWPHFVAQNYGRVVLTTSSGVLGLPNNLSYAAAKGGTIGLARSAKLAGEPHDIKVNLIAPAAMTRMGGGSDTEEPTDVPGQPYMPSDAVAPMVAYLAHENCPVSGEIYTAGAGRFARLFIASTEGYAHEDGPASIEDVAGNWDAINDEKGYYVPADLMAWTGSFLKHRFG
ncbi:SDR family NAD(P)-dependent oxidoreductase [Streptomyces pseudovenezuelae]|uniref:NAD(P)-dependent dehydrogenase (Short-subunit alcohol dehydrogenase family) n=1 Tax=Streptomyces pseudovenezuelae TaxID=67350 RepID=A0ABT6LNP5_9ACTN|nr:SDR family NAD(P)-dependent oxidoreductase [Streptomyces pseudovenezuelae]MDH6217929.1 NAD(P)-dependent dehydrogenase (short-subunit alcohol dehydrogenase family) [Streptomyces pseudovenezuelae]